MEEDLIDSYINNSTTGILIILSKVMNW